MGIDLRLTTQQPNTPNLHRRQFDGAHLTCVYTLKKVDHVDRLLKRQQNS